MESLIVLAVLALLTGSICGLITIVTLPKHRRRIEALEDTVNDQHRHLEDQQSAVDKLRKSIAILEGAQSTSNDKEVDSQPSQVRESSSAEQIAALERNTPEASISRPTKSDADSDWGGSSNRSNTWADEAGDRLAANLKANWMIWLGGLCVALSGIFLVRYSIEQGLLGPTARFVAGLLVGAALHAAAEYLRRRTGELHPSFAAMAGAGSITLYASLLAGMRMYDLINPGTAFVGMAAVALLTMAMAYIHGPVLAAFGILGAYLVPILASTGGGQIVIALIYVLIVTASALLLLRYVYTNWLWWGSVGGALTWWLITLAENGGDAFRPYYLTIFAYMLVAVPTFDWLLKARQRLTEEKFDLRLLTNLEPIAERSLVTAILLIVGALGLSLLFTTNYESPWSTLVPLTVMLLLARTRESLLWLPWLSFLTTLTAWFLPRVTFHDDAWTIEVLEQQQQLSFLYFLAALSLIVSGLSLWNSSTHRFKLLSSSLAILAPVLVITVGYLLTSHLVKSWHWGLGTALLALTYLIIATRVLQRSDSSSLVVWLFVGGHFALALAAAMVLNAATLTLALALQIISVAWVIRKFELPELDWLLKLVVGAVVIRLTLNPWLVDYPAEIHWPLWTYGGATLCAIAGVKMLAQYPKIARWAEAAALHLFVLTIWAELRYQLYDGVVFESEFSLTEAVINIALFGSLSLVYYRRSLVSDTLRMMYVGFSYILLAVAAASYLIVGIRTMTSDAWVYDAVGSTPIFNLLLAAYGTPIVLGYLLARFHNPLHKRLALGFTGIAGFVFVSLQIRHLWEGTIRYDEPPVSAAELYTYSAICLILAVAAVLGGAWRFGQDIYRAGMILLAVVIAKLFLIDMSDLEGLLRVASFMGLGLSLLAVSFLYQKLQNQTEQS